MSADQIRRAIAAAPRSKLPELTALLWQGFGEGHVSESEAEALSALIEARQAARRPTEQGTSITKVPLPPQGDATTAAPLPADAPTDAHAARHTLPPERPKSRAGSKPRTDASMERRRRWAASGRLPPALAARFTLAEQAALAVVAVEAVKRGDCRMAVGQIAALAGVSETTVHNALHRARQLGLVLIEERRRSGWRNDTNILRILSPEWTAWLRLARGRCSLPTPTAGGGCKSPNRTSTQVLHLGRSGRLKPSRQSGFASSCDRRAM